MQDALRPWWPRGSRTAARVQDSGSSCTAGRHCHRTPDDTGGRASALMASTRPLEGLPPVSPPCTLLPKPAYSMRWSAPHQRSFLLGVLCTDSACCPAWHAQYAHVALTCTVAFVPSPHQRAAVRRSLEHTLFPTHTAQPRTHPRGGRVRALRKQTERTHTTVCAPASGQHLHHPAPYVRGPLAIIITTNPTDFQTAGFARRRYCALVWT